MQRHHHTHLSHVNVRWHERHPLPPNASEEERRAWHLAHHAHCECAPLPHGDAEAERAIGPSLRPLLACAPALWPSRVAHALGRLQRKPSRAIELAALMLDEDATVAERARELMGMVDAMHPEWLTKLRHFADAAASARG